ncbi:yippee zinc-binding/DNA-binding /Mis18, centromere assembly-domain-containing protein [Xylariales sp. PMI_506]|nr:yippee zinc-binding/DNA-binding /Mis18, centromere assembly-domain-containing protein [Xylariales sp. PMI_506]
MISDTTSATGPAPKFPIYLLPSFNIPFRRRRQSSLSTASYASPPSESHVPSLSTSPSDSSVSSPFASPPPSSYFPSRFSLGRKSADLAEEEEDVPRLSRAHPDTIRCSTCSTDLAFTSQIVSKGFTGRYGRAYLVAPPEHTASGKNSGDLINIRVGKSETRLLVTGSHVVADITCSICYSKVGWKYVDAKEESQKYKVGKFILETQRVVDHRSWEHVPASELSELPKQMNATGAALELQEPIVFDSDDEDECEDIFSGTWDPVIVAKRRSRKVARRRETE